MISSGWARRLRLCQYRSSLRRLPSRRGRRVGARPAGSASLAARGSGCLGWKTQPRSRPRSNPPGDPHTAPKPPAVATAETIVAVAVQVQSRGPPLFSPAKGHPRRRAAPRHARGERRERLGCNDATSSAAGARRATMRLARDVGRYVRGVGSPPGPISCEGACPPCANSPPKSAPRARRTRRRAHTSHARRAGRRRTAQPRSSTA